jgi:hypothetical protein
MGEKDKVKQAYEDWKKGASLRELEQKYGLSRSTLARRFAGFKERGREEAIPRVSVEQSASSHLTGTPAYSNDDAAKVFELLEKGETLSRIVIALRLSPDAVKEIHGKWVKLKKVDANEPIVMEKITHIDAELAGHLVSHVELDKLLAQAKQIGGSRAKECLHAEYGDDLRRVCKYWTWIRNDGSRYHKEVDPLRCVFCLSFRKPAVLQPPRATSLHTRV